MVSDGLVHISLNKSIIALFLSSASQSLPAFPGYNNIQDYTLFDCDKFYSPMTGELLKLCRSSCEGNDSDDLASRLDQITESQVLISSHERGLYQSYRQS